MNDTATTTEQTGPAVPPLPAQLPSGANEMATALSVVERASPQSLAVFGSASAFEAGQRIAKALAASTIVPDQYRNNLPNCLVALEIAQRIGASPLQVMQNLYVIEGRPSWSSQYVIASLNSCGRFSPLRFTIERHGPKKIKIEKWEGPRDNRRKVVTEVEIDDVACTAWAIEKATGERIDGPTVSVEMAVREGWYFKNGSKWQTMLDLIIRYRAAAFFGRLYAPEVMMGMHTAEETADIIDVTPEPAPRPARERVPGAPNRLLDAVGAATVTTEVVDVTVDDAEAGDNDGEERREVASPEDDIPI